MKQPEHVYTAVALFGGGGLFSHGLEESRPGWRGIEGRVHVVASVDSWDKASAVHDYLVPGGRAVTMDLFEWSDYEAFHGHPPPPDWREATPADLRALCPDGPDILFTSPPCKGFSSNLSEGKSKTAKYQALNRLTVRGLWLALEAWADCLPRLVLLENVPRIRNRGADLLSTMRTMLRSAGYLVDDRDHDAGELGGLAQTRRRFLLAARLPGQAGFPVHLPVKQKLKGIGEVLGQLPCPIPGAEGLPPMHQVPRGQHWLTALRLALIRPGKDWRDLQTVEAYEVRWHPGRGFWMVGALRAGAWQVPLGWADGIEVGGRWAVDEETLGRAWSRETAYTVRGWGETMGAVAASRGGATASGASYVADPRIGRDQGRHPVYGWEDPAGAVTGQDGPSCGAASVADPRLTGQPWPGGYEVQPWDGRGRTVTAVHASNTGAAHTADPRLGCAPRAGAYGVTGWDGTSPTVAASVDVHAGTAALADGRVGAVGVPAALSRGPDHPLEGTVRSGAFPTLPAPTDRGAWVILSPGGAWHRPCTTLEVALLQGLPATVRGKPLDLYALGLSDADAREVIGNGVPPPAAEAIGEEFGQALLESDGVVPVRLMLGGRWVTPAEVVS